MVSFLAFCIVIIALFAYSVRLALWVIGSFVVICFLGGVISGLRNSDENNAPEPRPPCPPKDEKSHPYHPYPKGHRRINPDTGRPWWDE